jgi:hypothetical protein
MVFPASSTSGVFQKLQSVTRPLAGMHRVRVQLDVVTQLQQQGEDELRHRYHPVSGDIGHNNAVVPGGFDVHDVVPGGEHTDVA